MDISVEAHISYPRELAYRTLRDRLVEVGEFMPNITKIEVKSRDDKSDGVVDFVNVWHGKADVPGLIRAIIRPEMIRWTDYAHWDESDWSCDWRSETAFLTDKVDCSGRNTYETLPDGTTMLHIKGDLKTDLAGIPGVPRLMARKVGPAVEKFIVGLIEPNLRSTCDALEKFLDSEAAKG